MDFVCFMDLSVLTTRISFYVLSHCLQRCFKGYETSKLLKHLFQMQHREFRFHLYFKVATMDPQSESRIKRGPVHTEKYY